MGRALAPSLDDDLGRALFDGATGHRAPARFHCTADVVDITAVDLGEVPQWPFVVDEAFRLLAANGVLRLRLTESRIAEKHEVARTINALSAVPPRLIDVSEQDGAQLLALDVARRPVNDDITRFTVGVSSDGRNLDRLRDLLDTVRGMALPAKTTCEILVCGPRDVLHDAQLGTDVQIIGEDPAFAAIPWITGKKNRMVERATAPNLIICHDRYRFPPDFIQRLAEWGGDYSFITPRAMSPDGTRFPDWHALGGAPDEVRVPIGLIAYDDYHPGMYANGGLIVAKRDTLLEHPLAEMLWWGEAEDVELSRRLNANGHILRLAPTVAIESIETTPAYIAGFTPIRPQPGERATWATHRLTPPSTPAGTEMAPHVITGTDAHLEGRRIEWHAEPGRLSITMATTPHAAASVHISMRAAHDPGVVQVLVDGKPVRGAAGWNDASCVLAARFRLCADGRSTQVEVTTEHHHPVVIDQVIEVVEPAADDGPVQLGHGWWPREAWGAWTSAPTAQVLVREDTTGLPHVRFRTPPAPGIGHAVEIATNGQGRRHLAVDDGGTTFIPPVAPHPECTGLWHLLAVAAPLAPVLVPDGPRDTRRIGAGILL